jgi:hypothetical protein
MREGYKNYTEPSSRRCICLPPSRPSLTSYALETRGAMRILRFLALDDLISGGLGSFYIA